MSLLCLVVGIVERQAQQSRLGQPPVWLNHGVLHENVDKDPDLRKSSDLEEASTWMPRLITFGAMVALAVGVVIVLIYYSPAWGPNQWGNVGTWLAGIATSLAVIVAVWQTNNANKQARSAEMRAHEEAREMADRHRAEIVAADQRLIDQLNAQRSIEQIAAISRIWGVLAEVQRHVWLVDEAMHSIEKDDESEELLKVAYDPYDAAKSQVKAAFTTAYMLVHDTEVIALLERTEVAQEALEKAVQKAYRDHDNKRYHDQGSLISAMHAVNDLRDETIKLVKLRISPLRSSPPTPGHTETHPAASPEAP